METKQNEDWQVKADGEALISLPLCLPQIPEGPPWSLSRLNLVTGYLLRDRKFHHHVHRSTLMVHILIHLVPLDAFPPNFPNIILILYTFIYDHPVQKNHQFTLYPYAREKILHQYKTMLKYIYFYF